jgi:anti-sigma28 factor (negative regulator of flagellin synthesis)
MRPELRSPLYIAQLLDEVQSLLLQHDREAYNRQDVPVGGPLELPVQDNAMTTPSQDQNPMSAGRRPKPAQPAETVAAPAGHVPAGRLAGNARAARLAEIRAAIADGSYDTEERLEQALDRFLQRVDG